MWRDLGERWNVILAHVWELRKNDRFKKILLKWQNSHTLVGCSRVGWTSPRSSQHSLSSGSPLRISAPGNLHLTKNRRSQDQMGKQQERAFSMCRVFLSAVIPESCFPLSLSRGGGESALSGGCWDKHVIAAVFSTTQPTEDCAFPSPRWPVALGASSGARPAGLPLCFQQHFFHVALLGGRGDLFLAPAMTCALRGGATEMELNPGPWKSIQGLWPIC